MKTGTLVFIIGVLVGALLVETAYLVHMYCRRDKEGGMSVSEFEKRWEKLHAGILRSPAMRFFQSDASFDDLLEGWDPNQEMELMRGMMHRVWDTRFGPAGYFGLRGLGLKKMRTEPQLNLEDTGDMVVMRLDVPGVEKDQIHVKVEHDVLAVWGEKNEGGTSSRDFSRSVPLPQDVDTKSITANIDKGVLTIRIPKKEKST